MPILEFIDDELVEISRSTCSIAVVGDSTDEFEPAQPSGSPLG